MNLFVTKFCIYYKQQQQQKAHVYSTFIEYDLGKSSVLSEYNKK